MPFREESCRSSCIYNGPLHSHSRDAVNQHLSTRAGAESIQLIYSGRALQALSDLARQFQCHPIFWRELPQSGNIPNLEICPIWKYSRSGNVSNLEISLICKYPRSGNIPSLEISPVWKYPRSGNIPYLEISLM